MSLSENRSLAADDLREQAAACRRMALRALTIGGTAGLSALADLLDSEARQLDPMSERRP